MDTVLLTPQAVRIALMTRYESCLVLDFQITIHMKQNVTGFSRRMNNMMSSLPSKPSTLKHLTGDQTARKSARGYECVQL